MKKTICLSIILSIIFSMFTIMPVSAAEENIYISGDWVFEGTSGRAKITHYSGSESFIKVPTSLSTVENGTFVVTEIGDKAFLNNENIISISFPENLTDIGASAFEGSTLSSITFPKYFSKIGKRAFAKCENITSITLPAYIAEIGSGAFENCINLASINIPKNVTISGSSGAFKNCEMLKTITIEKGRAVIDAGSFSGSGIERIEIPSGVTKIKAGAFKECSLLKEITIPDTVTTIEKEVFNKCENLDNVILPDSITTLGTDLFKECLRLKNIKISENISTIPAGLLRDCQSLEAIVIPNKVEKINENAFYGCTSLKNVTLSENLKNLGTTTAGAVFCGCSVLEEIEIPKTIEIIGPSTFLGCLKIKEIVIPYGISSIYANTFKNCLELNTITIPSSVENIHVTAFTYFDQTTVNCVKGSAADDYAKSNNMPKTYFIEKIPVKYTNISGFNSSVTYNTLEQKQNLKITFKDYTLIEGKDYEVSYINNINAGTATMNIVGKGSFEGSLSKTFQIKTASISSCKITLSQTKYVYTGAMYKPNVTVKLGNIQLTENIHYTLSYQDNILPGTAKITITGLDNISNSKNIFYIIEGAPIKDANVTMSATTFIYDGKAKCPTVTVILNNQTLSNNIDYKITYTNNINAGTASVTITGKGNYSGKIVKKFTINQINLSKAKITLSKTKYSYNGSYLKPSVTVKNNNKTLILSKDYKVSYKNNYNVGTATVTITGINNYNGTIIRTFNINPTTTTISNIKGYKKKLTVKWKKKNVQVTGYQIQYSTSKKFKNAKTITIKNNNTTSRSIKKLKAKKRYYVRIRTYTTINSKKFYSSWSSSKNIKTK